MHGYESKKDYYDNYLFGRSPEDVRRKEQSEARDRADERRRVEQEMEEYASKYGT